MYRDPSCYVWDIVKLTGKSERTAQRILKKIKQHYGLAVRQKPTLQQAKAYLVEIKTT